MKNTVAGFADTIAWYNANAQKYADASGDLPSLAFIQNFLTLIPQNGSILDAGCAAGRDTHLFAERGFSVVGLDLSRSLLEVARAKYPEIQFVEGNFLELPFSNNSFDGVWAHASLVHLETTSDVSTALAEFYRVLQQDGALHVFVKQQQGTEKTSVVSDKLSGHERFFQWFTKDEMKELVEAADFTILELIDDIPDPAGREELKWIRVLARK